MTCIIDVSRTLFSDRGKNEDTSSSVTCIIDVPLSLTLCSVKVCYEDTNSSVACIINMPLSLTSCSGRDRQSVLLKLRERMKTPVVQ